jgi:hypothetical protein
MAHMLPLAVLSEARQPPGLRLLYSSAMQSPPPTGSQPGWHRARALRSCPPSVRPRGLMAQVLGLFCGVVALAGCELGANFGDLGEQLLDPEIQGVDAPGQRFVEGPHFDLNVLPDETGKRYVVARNADSELTVIDFASAQYCRAGRVVRYDGPVTPRSGPALIPLLVERAVPEGEPARIDLTFSSFDCQRSAFSVPVSGLPTRVVSGLRGGSGTGLLVKSPEGGLLLVDPWAQTIQRLADTVRNEDPGLAFGHFFWIERGEIVISDERLQPVARVGQNVAAVALAPDGSTLVYVEAGAEGAGGTLYAVDARGTQDPRQVSEDACSVRFLTLNERTQLSYLSPCSERQLVLRDMETDRLRVIDSNVAGPPAVRSLGGQSMLTYVTTPSAEAEEGALWLLAEGQDKVLVAENTRIGPSTVSGNGWLLTVLDWASTGGRLVEWRDAALTEVAQGVIELLPLGRMANDDLTLLGNFDGVTGDLLRLRPDLSTELLAQGVPTRAANEDAFIANFDGEAGDLMLFNRDDGSSEPLAQGVGKGAFIFTQQFGAILMLASRNSELRTNTLRMHLLESKRDFELHDGVTEAREVAFPSPGILYNVVNGDDAGIWFAKTL